MGKSERRDSPAKEHVDVICVFWSCDGHVTPLRFRRESGAVVLVERVLDMRRAASLRSGGQGLRYTCRIFNEEADRTFAIYLFHDGDYWFIERDEESGDLLEVVNEIAD